MIKKPAKRNSAGMTRDNRITNRLVDQGKLPKSQREIYQQKGRGALTDKEVQMLQQQAQRMSPAKKARPLPPRTSRPQRTPSKPRRLGNGGLGSVKRRTY